jgi:hypothetical protein
MRGKRGSGTAPWLSGVARSPDLSMQWAALFKPKDTPPNASSPRFCLPIVCATASAGDLATCRGYRWGTMTAYHWTMVALGAVLGASVGSFAGVVVYRVPRRQSVVRPPSHCGNCGCLIPAWAKVPVLAWPLLRGRCRSCGSRIGIQYWLLELWCTAWAAVWLAIFGLAHWFLWPAVVVGWLVPMGVLMALEKSRVTTR